MGKYSKSVAFRCDGDDTTGAGHVGRCLPLADRFSACGWRPIFVGSYKGLPRAMISASGHTVVAPCPTAPCDISVQCDAAILDSYSLGASDIASLAELMPTATLAEGPSYPGKAVRIDFHVDRLGEQETRWLLPGPRFAPVDPRYRQPPSSGTPVRRVLVTLGGGASGRDILPIVRAQVLSRFPSAEIVEPATADLARYPHRPLYAILKGVDFAVCGAGFTAYEMATAGVPSLLVQLADNQDRVARGMAAHGLAGVTDARHGDFESQLRAGVDALASPRARAEIAARAVTVFDGRGVRRVVGALTSSWNAPAND